MPVKKLEKDKKKTAERLTELGKVQPGEYVRFPHECTYEEALTGKDDATFWKVIKRQPEEKDRVDLVSQDGKLSVKRDSSHRVVVHPFELHIGAAEMVPAE